MKNYIDIKPNISKEELLEKLNRHITFVKDPLNFDLLSVGYTPLECTMDPSGFASTSILRYSSPKFLEPRLADFTDFSIQNHNLNMKNSIDSIGLTNINFKGVYFCYVHLNGWNLKNSDFSKATLYMVNFRQSNLDNCDFSGSEITGAILKEAIVRGAKFVSSKLKFVNFEKTDLTGVDLTNAILDRCDFTNAILDGCDFTNTITILGDDFNNFGEGL